MAENTTANETNAETATNADNKETAQSDAAAGAGVPAAQTTQETAPPAADIKPADTEKPEASSSNVNVEQLKNELDGLKTQLEQERLETAVSNLLGGYSFASPRVKASVAEELKNKGFKVENGRLEEKAAAFIEELKKTEPDSFAKEAAPKGIFMTKTESADPADASLKDVIFKGFGFSS